MTRIFLFLSLFMLTACERDLKNFFFPASEYLQIPVAEYDVRLHCNPYCPPHDEIRAVMAEVRAELQPLGLSHDPYKVWSGYAITFSDDAIFWDGDQITAERESPEDLQIWGATYHGRRAIYIHTEDQWKGIRPGVLDWELRLPIVEKELPGSTEEEKVEWLETR